MLPCRMSSLSSSFRLGRRLQALGLSARPCVDVQSNSRMAVSVTSGAAEGSLTVGVVVGLLYVL